MPKERERRDISVPRDDNLLKAYERAIESKAEGMCDPNKLQAAGLRNQSGLAHLSRPCDPIGSIRR